ncbi:MAG TPA: hypothetical protein VEX15_24035 [Nocardioidaceae bacterium]|nr:hypothetical protein [Nocardioidaceae bacterium]
MHPSAGWPFRDRLRAGATTFGGAMAFAGLLLAGELTGGEFKWKTFLVMAGITVVLAVGCAVWYVALAAVPHSRWTASVLGAFAVKGIGLTILAPWSDKDAVPYLVGFGMIALGAAGYWFLRGSAFAFAAFLGAFIVANKFAGYITGDSDGPLMYGLVMLVLGLAVAAAGWRFDCRDITGLLGGAVALYGFVVVSTVGTLVAAFARGLNQLSSELGAGSAGVEGVRDLDNDLIATFILTLLLSLALTAMYAYSHNVGYLILAVLGAVQVLQVALAGVATEHPLRWGTIILCGIGGLLLVAAVVDQARRTGYVMPNRSGGAPVGGPPQGPPQGPPPGPPPGPPSGRPPGQPGQGPSDQPPSAPPPAPPSP